MQASRRPPATSTRDAPAPPSPTTTPVHRRDPIQRRRRPPGRGLGQHTLSCPDDVDGWVHLRATGEAAAEGMRDASGDEQTAEAVYEWIAPETPEERLGNVAMYAVRAAGFNINMQPHSSSKGDLIIRERSITRPVQCNGATIPGSLIVESNQSVALRDGCRVNGDVETGGNLVIERNGSRATSVGGDVLVTGRLSFTAGVVEGNVRVHDQTIRPPKDRSRTPTPSDRMPASRAGSPFPRTPLSTPPADVPQAPAGELEKTPASPVSCAVCSVAAKWGAHESSTRAAAWTSPSRRHGMELLQPQRLRLRKPRIPICRVQRQPVQQHRKCRRRRPQHQQPRGRRRPRLRQRHPAGRHLELVHIPPLQPPAPQPRRLPHRQAGHEPSQHQLTRRRQLPAVRHRTGHRRQQPAHMQRWKLSAQPKRQHRHEYTHDAVFALQRDHRQQQRLLRSDLRLAGTKAPTPTAPKAATPSARWP